MTLKTFSIADAVKFITSNRDSYRCPCFHGDHDKLACDILNAINSDAFAYHISEVTGELDGIITAWPWHEEKQLVIENILCLNRTALKSFANLFQLRFQGYTIKFYRRYKPYDHNLDKTQSLITKVLNYGAS